MAEIDQPRSRNACASTSSPCVSMTGGSLRAGWRRKRQLRRGPTRVGGPSGPTRRSRVGSFGDHIWGDSKIADIVQAVGARMSISVVPDPDANGARSRAGRRNVSYEPPRAPGSARRGGPGPPNEERAASPGASRQRPRGAVQQPRWPDPLADTVRAGSPGSHERRPGTQRRASRLIFAVWSSQAKVQVSDVDEVYGTHTLDLNVAFH